MKKIENNELKKFKTIYKNGSKIYKVWWYWNWKIQFYQHKKAISTNNIDINKIVVSNELSFGKKDFKYFPV